MSKWARVLNQNLSGQSMFKLAARCSPPKVAASLLQKQAIERPFAPYRWDAGGHSCSPIWSMAALPLVAVQIFAPAKTGSQGQDQTLATCVEGLYFSLQGQAFTYSRDHRNHFGIIGIFN